MAVHESGGIYTLPLNTQSSAHWGNTILVRLAVAIGALEKGFGSADIDPDEILEEVEEIIWIRRDMEDS